MGEQKHTLGTWEDFYVGYHVVCMMDILGQKDKLRQWGRVPTGSDPPEGFVEAIRKTAGTVLSLREMFGKYFRAASLPNLPGDGHGVGADSHRERYCRFKECQVGQQQFGDAFVFYARLTNTAGDVSVLPVHRILYACCMVMICGPAGKVPLRGSVCIGPGVELAEHTFYGPALAEAYELENKVAGYPRVLVADSVQQFLLAPDPRSDDPSVAKMMALMAQRCQSLIAKDFDGRLIVDYLGSGICDMMESDDLVREAIKHSYEFARNEKARFRAAGNNVLAERYGMLERYVGSRLPILGIGSAM